MTMKVFTQSMFKSTEEGTKVTETTPSLIHHPDRGFQHCSGMYQSERAKHSLAYSMADGYNCYQNALVERVNGILKAEFLPSQPADLEQARRRVDE